MICRIFYDYEHLYFSPAFGGSGSPESPSPGTPVSQPRYSNLQQPRNKTNNKSSKQNSSSTSSPRAIVRPGSRTSNRSDTKVKTDNSDIYSDVKHSKISTLIPKSSEKQPNETENMVHESGIAKPTVAVKGTPSYNHKKDENATISAQDNKLNNNAEKFSPSRSMPLEPRNKDGTPVNIAMVSPMPSVKHDKGAILDGVTATRDGNFNQVSPEETLEDQVQDHQVGSIE